jgi:hypothetical protein
MEKVARRNVRNNLTPHFEALQNQGGLSAITPPP